MKVHEALQAFNLDPMAITRQKKEEILNGLKDSFASAKSVAFIQYEGMTVAEVTDLRAKLRSADVDMKVAKKTLMKIAAKEHGVELPAEIMEGTVAAIFSKNDPAAGPKFIKQTAKTVEVLKLLGGVMEAKVLSRKDMQELADLPSREQLLAKFIGMMQAPLYGLRGLMEGPTSAFARALQELAKQKESAGAA